jgi:hypothetical protein
MYYSVYKITNLINNKTYIGIHKTENLDDGYMGSGKHLKYSIEKYGIENFIKEYLAIFDNPDDMYIMESQLVNEEFVNNKETYNLKIGGSGGFDFINNNEELRISKNRKARESTNKILLEKYGKNWRSIIGKMAQQDRTKESLILAAKKAQNTRLEKYGYEGTFNNKKHTKEAKGKIGEKNSKHQKGEKNSQYGTMWITNGKENKKIKKEELIPDGWFRGRKNVHNMYNF